MPDNLPQPLPGATALRSHLKALERGVADARNQRLGTPPAAAKPAGSLGSPSMFTGTIGAHPAQRSPGSPYAMPKPNPTTASANASGKPRAARAKSANDFGAFFERIEKREAS